MLQPFPIPVIETERLILRAHRSADLADCAQMWADPVVTRFIGGRPSSREEVWARMLRYAGHWSWFAFGYWLVQEKISGHFVGELGFSDYKRDLASPLAAMPELGWALTTSMVGRGYATEGALGAIGWFDRHIRSAHTFCLIAPENAPSLRVATKCGYSQSEAIYYREQPVLIYVRDLAAVSKAERL